MSDDVGLLKEAARLVVSGGMAANLTGVQRRMRLGFATAARLLRELERLGVLAPPREGGTWTVLTDPGQLDELLATIDEQAASGGLFPTAPRQATVRRPEPPAPDPERDRRSGGVARHAFRTAGEVELLAEHLEAEGWRTDSYGPSDLRAVANELRGMAIRAAMRSGDAEIVTEVTGRRGRFLDPPGAGS